MIDFAINVVLIASLAVAMVVTVVGLCVGTVVLVAVVRDFLQGGRKE